MTMINDEPTLMNTEISVGDPLITKGEGDASAIAAEFLKSNIIPTLEDMIAGSSHNTLGDDSPIDEMKVQITCLRGNKVTVDAINMFRNEGELHSSQSGGSFNSDTQQNGKKLFDQLAGGLAEDILNLPFGIK